ncbi:uncharacterized protein F5Z01DRAFT_731162 [Emericellopsis atlantica]|uniref:NmrA-like domain-containing protein n=1 Tax=Emericellopsis atlantica TaxID=2614577 RepID=A0A9P7ZE41_9HYPO|nr:uncharacterized protein F5Z01DRAFT_731162 [Emericellopsis atlantica]KAG9250041.1 hypothetical protein F5Z01DRAFT_731162 [Emericellopsis atlantica]
MATKIIAVVGATGNQGSSVAATFLQEPGWQVRGITRDPSKESARALASRGADVVTADLDVPGSMEKAFRGANVIFGTTDFVQHLQDPKIIAAAQAENRPVNELATERETEQAKRLIDAAAANVDALDLFVLSTLSDAKGLSQGKIQYNLHFDSKWAAVEYLKATYPALWAKTSLLQLGIFASNWKVPYYTPRKQEDGTFKLSLPMSGDKKFPIIDPNADTGHLTKALVHVAPGTHLVGATSMISWNEWCEAWSRQTKAQCKFEKLDRKVLEEIMGPLGREIADMFQYPYMDEFGYDGSDPTVVYPWDLRVEVATTPIEQYLARQDWSSVL